ncbi:MAG: LPS export ABC transporter permease LptG, partial [Gammaproteobacteria bacterium]
SYLRVMIRTGQLLAGIAESVGYRVVSIDLLFLLVNELRALGEGDYTFIKMLEYIVLVLPERLYFVFPMASLVGALLGLGLLAGHSELVVMRSSGVSLLQISWAVLRAALLLIITVTLLGELVVPRSMQYAEMLREKAVSGSQTVITPQGTWIRDGADFVRIKEILITGELIGVIRYQFNQQHELLSSTYATRAEYNTDQNLWVMHDVKQTNINGQETQVSTFSTLNWQSGIQPQLLNILIEEPENLSIVGLVNYIHYLQDNHLRVQEYNLALWKKLWQPFATIVMVFIAIPVIFGPLRSATMGLRLLTGVLLGFGFYILNQLFGPLSLVYASFPAPLAASLPSLVFALGGIILFRRIR